MEHSAEEHFAGDVVLKLHSALAKVDIAIGKKVCTK